MAFFIIHNPFQMPKVYVELEMSVRRPHIPYKLAFVKRFVSICKMQSHILNLMAVSHVIIKTDYRINVVVTADQVG